MKTLNQQILELKREFFDISELKYRLWSWYYSIVHPFRVAYLTIYAFFYWGWKLRKHRDFDYSELYEIIQLKLEKMYPIVCESPNRYFNKTRARKMKIAIGCLKSLNDHESRTSAQIFFEKHPELHILDHKQLMSTSRSTREVFLKLSKLEDKQKENKLKLFCKIFINDSQKWWD